MKFRYYLLLTAAALLLVGSFFLPNTVAAITDSRRLDNFEMIDSQSISFDTAPELELTERIALVASPNTEILALKTGQAMNTEMAKERAVRELERFFSDERFAFAFDVQFVEECAAAFVIDLENPSVNLIIWEITMTDTYGNVANVTIDDETGAILKLILRWGNKNNIFPDGINNATNSGQSDEEFNATALRISEMMAVYYGLPVTLADYQFSGSLAYYRADIFRDGAVIPMYGVVRESSFTMNEKIL